MPGNHAMNGILMARGKNIRKGKNIKGANIMDLAPTILYLKGNKIPEDMDGKVLEEIITEEFLKENDIKYNDEKGVSGHEKESPPLSREDEKEIIRKLKGLGYIG